MWEALITQRARLSTILEKSKETVLQFYKGTQKFCENIQMFEYNKVKVKLSNSQLNKLKTAVKNQTGVGLKMNGNNGNNVKWKQFTS